MPPDEQPLEFKVTAPPQGIAHLYANVAHLVWTGQDVTVQLYQIIQPNREIPSESAAPNELLHSATVTLTWNSAKLFHRQLSEVLERYEKAHGPIKTEFKAI